MARVIRLSVRPGDDIKYVAHRMFDTRRDEKREVTAIFNGINLSTEGYKVEGELVAHYRSEYAWKNTVPRMA